MARVKVDWSKVQMQGAEEAPALIDALPATVKEAVAKTDSGIKVSVAKVTLNVGKDDSVVQYGAAYLKVKECDAANLEVLIGAIRDSGPQAVIDSYNGIQRDARLKFLSDGFGDVTEAIEEAVTVCIEKMGMDRAEALEFVINRRKKANMRV